MAEVNCYDDMPDDMKQALQQVSAAVSARLMADDCINNNTPLISSKDARRAVYEPLTDKHWDKAYSAYARTLLLSGGDDARAMRIFCGTVGLIAGHLMQAHIDSLKE